MGSKRKGNARILARILLLFQFEFSMPHATPTRSNANGSSKKLTRMWNFERGFQRFSDCPPLARASSWRGWNEERGGGAIRCGVEIHERRGWKRTRTTTTTTTTTRTRTSWSGRTRVEGGAATFEGYGKWERWRKRGANFKWLSLFSKVELPKGASAAPALCLPRFHQRSCLPSSSPPRLPTNPTSPTRRFPPPSNHLRHLTSPPSPLAPRGFDALFTNLTRLVMELFSTYFRGKSGIYTLPVPGVRSFSSARAIKENEIISYPHPPLRTIQN